MAHHAVGSDAVGLLEVRHGGAGLLPVGAGDEVLAQVPQLVKPGLDALHVVALVSVLHDADLDALVHEQQPGALAQMPVGVQVVMALEADEGRFGDAAEVFRGLVAVHVAQLHEPGLDDGDGGRVVPLLQDLVLQGLRDGGGGGRGQGGPLGLTDHGQGAVPAGGGFRRQQGGPGHVGADHQGDDEQDQGAADRADADLHGLVEGLEPGGEIRRARLDLVPQEEEAGLHPLPQLLEQGAQHLPHRLGGHRHGVGHLLAGGTDDGPDLQEEGGHRIEGAPQGPAEGVPARHEPGPGRFEPLVRLFEGAAKAREGLPLVGLLRVLLLRFQDGVFFGFSVHTVNTSVDAYL